MKKIIILTFILVCNSFVLFAQNSYVVNSEVVNHPTSIAKQGNFIYVLQRDLAQSDLSKIIRIDISGPDPILTDVVSGFDSPLAIHGNYLFVANAGNISKIDVSAPTPILTEVVTGINNVEDLAFDGNSLYILNEGKIQKIDDVTAANPTVTEIVTGLVGSFNSNLFPRKFAIKNNFIYITQSSLGKIVKIDKTVTNPVITDVVTGLHRLTALAIKDNDLYFAEGPGNTSSVTFGSISKIDITDSTPIPSLVFSRNAANQASNLGFVTSMIISGNDLFYLQLGAAAFDVRFPSIVGKIDITETTTTPCTRNITPALPRLSFGLALNGNTLYIPDFNGNKIVKIDDITLANPVVTDVVTGITSPYDIVLNGNTLYVSQSNSGKIVKINDITIANPIVTDVVTGLITPRNMAFKDGFLYVTQVVPGLGNDKISKINTTVGSPTVEDFVTGLTGLRDLAIRDDDLYFVENGKISRVHIPTLSTIEIVAAVGTLDAFNLAFIGNELYVTHSSFSRFLSKIDVTEPNEHSVTFIAADLDLQTALVSDGVNLYGSLYNSGDLTSSILKHDLSGDTQAPVIQPLEDQMVFLTINDPTFTLPDYRTLATVTASCNSNITLTQSPQEGTVLNTAGTHTITITATNANANSSQQSFNLVLRNFNPQTQTLTGATTANCGDDITLSLQHSETNFNYFLRNDTTKERIGDSQTGTGSALDFQTGAVGKTTDYHVFAANPSFALDFDGDDDYITIPHSNSLDFTTTNRITIEAWVNPSDLSANGGFQHIFRKDNGGGGRILLSFQENNILAFGLETTNGGYQELDVTINNPEDYQNEWVHILATYDGGTMKLYKDGSEIGNLPKTGAIVGAFVNTPATIGAFTTDNTNFSQEFNGKIASLRVWDKAITTATEVQQAQDNLFVGDETNLVAYYPFFESAGTQLTDVTANTNNGTINGVVWDMTSTANENSGVAGGVGDIASNTQTITLNNPAIVYVDATATGDNTGCDWANALLNVQDAVNIVAENGEILIAEGTYSQNSKIIIAKQITLKGGFPSGGGTQDIANNLTFLDGNNSDRVLEHSGAGELTIQGLTIQNGRVNAGPFIARGGGIFSITGNLTLDQVVLQNNETISASVARGGGLFSESTTATVTIINSNINNNSAEVTNSWAQGGGIYVTNILNIENSIIEANKAEGNTIAQGGGIYAKHINSVGCQITANTSTSINASAAATLAEGGAIYIVEDGSLDLTNTKIQGNSALHSRNNAQNATTRGGGVFISANSTAHFINTEISANRATHVTSLINISVGGGGISVINSPITLTNCLLFNNSIRRPLPPDGGGGIGGGINGGTIVFQNSILWNNTREDSSGTGSVFADEHSNTNSFIANHSLIKDDNPTTGTGNIDATAMGFDPLFVNEANGDFRLQSGSPLIDAGLDSFNTTILDLDGNPRFVGTIDVGPYEFAMEAPQEVNLSVSTNSLTEDNATAIAITVTTSNPVIGDQTVDLILSGTATNNVDYTLIPTTITILDGQTTGTADFTVIDDSDIEGDETATITMDNPSVGISLGTIINQDITIIDDDFIMAVCQNSTVQLDINGNASILGTDVDGGSTASLGVASFSVSPNSFSCSDIGTPVTVTLTVTDNGGNTATCTSTVTVEDNLVPILTCPNNQSVAPDAVGDTYEVPDYFATAEATAIDNCTDPVTNTTQTPVAGTLLADGTHTVTLTATDDAGNTATCDFELIVEDTLGIDDNGDIGTLILYPNPATNVVYLSNPQSISLIDLAIYDLTGRLIRAIQLEGMGTEKAVDITDLASATYMIIITGESGQIVKQLIRE